MPDSSRCDVFISYRREGGEALAMLLHDRLADAGYRVFLDVESLRSGNFNEAILGKIEECTDMLVLLPPNALDRCVNEDDWVRREVEHAFLHGKNIVPVMMRGFSWPESLPEGLSALPNCNGVTADNMELFDGILLRIQDKLLRSKPIKREPEDPEFKRLYHRFQYLIFSDSQDKAGKIAVQLMEQFPDRAEAYLCQVQYKFKATHLELLALSTETFEEDPTWKYALHIAPTDLQAKLKGILADSLALRQKKAEEARREVEIRKLQEPRHKPEKETAAKPPKAISEEEVSRTLDTIRARVRRLNEHPLTATTKVRELYAIQDMMTSIQHVRPMQEEMTACTQTIDKLLKAIAEEALMASEILSCYEVLGEIQGVHQKNARKKLPAGTVSGKNIRLQEGVVQCCMRNNCRLALLVDGSVLPLDAASTTWMGSEADHWDNITWLDGSMPAGVRGFRKDGTYVFAPDEAQPTHYECEAIADSPFEYRASGIRLRKAAPEDSRVLLSYDGTLTLRDERNPASGPVLHKDVIGFHIRGYTCFALLRNGHVAEIDLTTWACREFSCAMTEEAVKNGVRNWRQNRAEELLALRKKQLRNPVLLAAALLGGSLLMGPAALVGAGAAALSLGTRHKKCQRSIEYLQALLAEQ